MASSGSAKLLNFLRENESSLLSLRPRKPGSAQPLATGWNANRGKLLREAVEGIRGQERSISLEQRWGKVLCKVLLSASDEDFATLSDGIRAHVLELACHPHGAKVMHTWVYQCSRHAGLIEIESSSAKIQAGLAETSASLLISWEQLTRDPSGSGVATSLLLAYSGHFEVGEETLQGAKLEGPGTAGRFELKERADAQAPAAWFWQAVETTRGCILLRPVGTCTDTRSGRIVALMITMLNQLVPKLERAGAELGMLLGGLFRDGADTIVPALAATPAGMGVLQAAARAGVRENCPGGDKVLDLLTGYACDRASWLCSTPSTEGKKGRAKTSSGAGVSFAMFCCGSTDQKSFKPSKDDSQWWGRRDALCRSVAASLWGAGGRAYQHVHECSLLFDDRGVFTMDTKRFAAGIGVPTEKALIRAWRDAALGTPAAGLRVKRAPEPCGCGSSSSGGGGGGGEGHACCKCGVKKAAEFILKGHDAATTVVVVLHEDYPRELPVFGGEESCDALASQGIGHVIFVMGTVRDVTEEEENAFTGACISAGYRVAGCNLGRTAEFTSKVVHAINVHALCGRAPVAVAKLVSMGDAALTKLPPQHRAIAAPSSPTASGSKRVAEDSQGGGAKKKKKGAAEGGGESDKGVIHVIALASMTADSVSSQEGERERMYTLSQVFVCTLWRSNLAEIMHKGMSSGRGSVHSCRLSVCFACGTVVEADQDLVLKMASEHRAAPSERQVLEVVESAIARKGGVNGRVRVYDTWGPKKAVRALLKPYAKHQVLVLETGANLWQGAYEGECGCSDQGGGKPLKSPLAVIVRFGDEGEHPLEGALERALDKDGRKTMRASVCPGGASAQASICGLQHWDYHHRLSRALSACTAGQSAGRDEGEPPEWGRDFVASIVELCSGTKRPVERLKEALAVKGQP